jgi:hypothetical protein
MASKNCESIGGFPRPWIWSVAAAGLVMVVGAVFIFDPAKTFLFPPCMFHELTGLDCPGCGSTRAFHQLVHGHLLAAVRYNAMFVASVPLGGWFAWTAWKRRANNDPRPLIRPVLIWTYFGAWLLFGVLRDLPVPWLAWFAP